ncbi:unnamed protein product [Sphagnum jensenii]|uniref:DDT domain-containing protein n=1 Tax=Sphagnum jensenii TaxID=128206 RepID=A0ABP0XGI9_9BRYO
MAKEGLKTTRNGAANLQLSPTSSALRSPPHPKARKRKQYLTGESPAKALRSSMMEASIHKTRLSASPPQRRMTRASLKGSSDDVQDAPSPTKYQRRNGESHTPKNHSTGPYEKVPLRRRSLQGANERSNLVDLTAENRFENDSETLKSASELASGGFASEDGILGRLRPSSKGTESKGMVPEKPRVSSRKVKVAQAKAIALSDGKLAKQSVLKPSSTANMEAKASMAMSRMSTDVSFGSPEQDDFPSGRGGKSQTGKELLDTKTIRTSPEDTSLQPAGCKRRKFPAVRMVGTRIYDSENGQTCHQCRQKTLEFMAVCRSKNCTQKFCPKCLFNRYGEMVGDSASNESWCCPRCRGNCNCSICMKKQGRPPTGILAHTAKAIGYGSVAELLEQHPCAQENSGPPIQRAMAKSEYNGVTVSHFAQSIEARARNGMGEGTGMRHEAQLASNGLASPGVKDAIKDAVGVQTPAVEGTNNGPIQTMRMPRRARWVPGGLLASVNEVVVPEELSVEEKIVLPTGSLLITVGGIEIAQNAVGPALQLLEFCCAFSKPLGIKKGAAVKILQEIVKGCNMKRGSQSQVIQFQVRLLTLILAESDEPCNIAYSLTSKNSWLESLKKYLQRKDEFFSKERKPKNADDQTQGHHTSTLLFEDGLDSIIAALERGVEGYMDLQVNEKLQLLNILCNDSLSTSITRDYIESVITETEERDKNHREEARALRKEAKAVRETHKEAHLKSLLATGKHLGPLSQEEQLACLADLRAEAAKLSEAADSRSLSRKDGQRVDAIRTDAIHWDDGARAVWKLQGVDNRSSVVLQDISNIEGSQVEKWSVYSEDEEKMLEAYIAQKKRKRYTRRPYKRVQLAPPPNNPKEPQTASPDNQLNDSAVNPARDNNATSSLLDQEDESLSSDEQAEVEDEEAGVSTPDEESDSVEDTVSEEDVVE